MYGGGVGGFLRELSILVGSMRNALRDGHKNPAAKRNTCPDLSFNISASRMDPERDRGDDVMTVLFLVSSRFNF